MTLARPGSDLQPLAGAIPLPVSCRGDDEIGLARAISATGSGRRRGEFRIIRVLVGRELASRLSSAWFYIIASGACLIAGTVGAGFVRGFETETVLVSANPLAVVDSVVLVFLGAVLGLRLSASLAWEREHRTIEVLLSGPVRWWSIVVAKFLVEFLVLGALLVVYSGYVALARPLGSTLVDGAWLLSLWCVAPMVLPLLGLGLLVSAAFAGVRPAVTAYLLVLGMLGALEAAKQWLAAQNPAEMALAALHLRSMLDAVHGWLAWLSPLAYAGDLARIAGHGFDGSWPRLCGAVMLTLAAIVVAVAVARRRGPS
jgi:hypothetical protein